MLETLPEQDGWIVSLHDEWTSPTNSAVRRYESAIGKDGRVVMPQFIAETSALPDQIYVIFIRSTEKKGSSSENEISKERLRMRVFANSRTSVTCRLTMGRNAAISAEMPNLWETGDADAALRPPAESQALKACNLVLRTGDTILPRVQEGFEECSLDMADNSINVRFSVSVAPSYLFKSAEAQKQTFRCRLRENASPFAVVEQQVEGGDRREFAKREDFVNWIERVMAAKDKDGVVRTPASALQM
jgi:hypothetical protein